MLVSLHAKFGMLTLLHCLQGEQFAQSILDKIAQQVPGHAMQDGVLAHRHVGGHDAAPGPANTSPCHVDGGCTHVARSVPDLIPASIAEEPGSSADGSSKESKCSSSSGASVVDITVQCQGVHEHEHRPPPAPGPDGSPAVLQDGGTHDLLSTSQLQSSLSSGTHGSQELLPIPRAAEPVAGLGPLPPRRTTWEARRTAEGPAAVSPLAANAVYVLHRSIIHVAPSRSRWQRVHKVLMEVVYQQLWQLTTRFWEGWKVPPARMFEVGMVVEIAGDGHN